MRGVTEEGVRGVGASTGEGTGAGDVNIGTAVDGLIVTLGCAYISEADLGMTFTPVNAAGTDIVSFILVLYSGTDLAICSAIRNAKLC